MATVCNAVLLYRLYHKLYVVYFPKIITEHTQNQSNLLHVPTKRNGMSIGARRDPLFSFGRVVFGIFYVDIR